MRRDSRQEAIVEELQVIKCMFEDVFSFASTSAFVDALLHDASIEHDDINELPSSWVLQITERNQDVNTACRATIKVPEKYPLAQPPGVSLSTFCGCVRSQLELEESEIRKQIERR